jgi:hypothetical protein
VSLGKAVAEHLRLGPMTVGARRGLTYIFLLTVILIGGSYWQSSQAQNRLASQQAALRMSVQAQCRFDADLGSAPITLNPATGKASLLGVSIVSDSRVAWHGLGCPGKLAPPSPSFLKWSKFYGLPYR